MNVTRDEFGFVRGMLAAVEMMEGMAGGCDVEHHFVQGRRHGAERQVNSVRDALARLQARGDESELAGFCAVLTEIVAEGNHHGQWEEVFRKYAERRRRTVTRRQLGAAGRRSAVAL